MNEEEVCQLAQAAVRDFGAAVFWSIPGFRVTDVRAARIATKMLRKHGGLKGWQKSQEIEYAIDRVSEASIDTPRGE
jgi:hypothetical protein